MIYTTNVVEGMHRQIRKVTKTKGSFDNDMTLLKLVYLSMQRVYKKWNKPCHNWSLIVQQLGIKFGERMPVKLTLNHA
jgi:transposase-like protein